MLPLRRALALLCISMFSVLALPGISSAAARPAFRITRLVLPKKMIENGPSENMFVYWKGDATFPVTLYIAEPTCAENVTCNSGHLTVLHHNDPIEWRDLWKCTGDVTSTMFSYSFWLVDAKGVKTQKVPADVLCTE
jgi:hypothetical protein